jgi:hypothetical protein
MRDKMLKLRFRRYRYKKPLLVDYKWILALKDEIKELER